MQILNKPKLKTNKKSPKIQVTLQNAINHLENSKKIQSLEKLILQTQTQTNEKKVISSVCVNNLC